MKACYTPKQPFKIELCYSGYVPCDLGPKHLQRLSAEGTCRYVILPYSLPKR